MYGSGAQGKEEEGKGGQLGMELHSCLISAGQGLEGAGVAWWVGSCQKWVVGTAQVLHSDEFHFSH